MGKEPVVSVGIMFEPEINVVFSGGYTVKGILLGTSDYSKVDIGVFSALGFRYSDNFICWNGRQYEELYFTAQGEDAFFELKDVTIGINFHWERKENQRFAGDLKIIVEDGRLTAINVIKVEKYLTSVISSEMSATASEELLKAHAVISRSWLLAQIEKNRKISGNGYSSSVETEAELVRWYDREDHLNFDVCADDHCQRYQGMTRASTPQVVKAIEATRGEVLTYGGVICDARFSKCCGGAVEEFQNCWEDTEYPYLVKLRDSADSGNLPDLTVESEAEKWILSTPEAFCNTDDKEILSQVLNNYDQETSDFYRWEKYYSVDGISELVRKRTGIDFGKITDLIPVQRGTSGRLVRLEIVGTKRRRIIGKELEIRRTLSESHLYSSAFVVKKEFSSDGSLSGFTLKGAGWGHGVGLCQIGAAVMGARGYGYRQILLHYFVGADIEKQYM